MFLTADHLADDDLDALDLSTTVLVEEHPIYANCLLFRVDDYASFYERYSSWVSRHQVLSELFSLGKFVERLNADGWTVIFEESSYDILGRYQRYSKPLEIEGYKLHGFQNFAIRQALERARTGSNATERLFFWNWAAGAGKSYVCGAAAGQLLEADAVDLVIAVTTAKLKRNLARFIEHAGIEAYLNDSVTPAIRRRRYFDPHDCFVMNFEKLRVDRQEIVDLTEGKRVLFILDEAHRVVSEAGHNQARKALDQITKGCVATVWPMSATVVGGNPLRYRDVYSLDGFPRRNPLGTKGEFCDRYAHSVREIPIVARNGARFNLTKYDWDLPALHEIRHRVVGRTMAVRKSDDALKGTFQGLDCWPIAVEPSETTQQLYEIIVRDAGRVWEEHKAQGETASLAQHYLLLRMILCTPRAVERSTNELAAMLLAEYPQLITDAHNAKLEMLNDMCDSIRESGDKVVIFIHWNPMGLQLLAPRLSVPHITHHGEMDAKAADNAIQRFKDDPDITALFTTDAGAEGLNLQCARYTINIDPVYSYDLLYQRNSRIDRSDSHLDGLTSYVLVTENSIEERIWGICDERRRLAEAIQGTTESLSYEGRAGKSEQTNMYWMIFGEDEGSGV